MSVMSIIFWLMFGSIVGYFIDNPITWCVVAFVYIYFISIRFDNLQGRLEMHIDDRIDKIDSKLDNIISDVSGVQCEIRSRERR